MELFELDRIAEFSDGDRANFLAGFRALLRITPAKIYQQIMKYRVSVHIPSRGLDFFEPTAQYERTRALELETTRSRLRLLVDICEEAKLLAKPKVEGRQGVAKLRPPNE